MEKIIGTLFSEYLKKQNISQNDEYSKLSKTALQKEKELSLGLNEEQHKKFDELLEIISRLHFLEVTDAFSEACKMGANALREFLE